MSLIEVLDARSYDQLIVIMQRSEDIYTSHVTRNILIMPT
jgi:hypothetical protein